MAYNVIAIFNIFEYLILKPLNGGHVTKAVKYLHTPRLNSKLIE